eukprot:2814140-Lingulodinium_polyedra.AAC.1
MSRGSNASSGKTSTYGSVRNVTRNLRLGTKSVTCHCLGANTDTSPPDCLHCTASCHLPCSGVQVNNNLVPTSAQ